jgi:heme oxygenase
MNSRIILSAVSNTQEDVLTALRRATAERHAELDARTPLAAAQPDLRAYRDHLRLLEAWLAPMQDWLALSDDGLAPRDYLRLIRADLAHAALADLPGHDAAGPFNPSSSSSSSSPSELGGAYRWGVRYVIEGSQLGGAVLYKRLAQRLAPHPLGYLRGAGSPGPRWNQFIAALRAEVTTPAQIEAACRGARQAFDSLIELNRIESNRIEPQRENQ